MFVLSNYSDGCFMGCFSSFEKAKKAYDLAMAKRKNAKYTPGCYIEHVPVDEQIVEFYWGHSVKARWTNADGKEWIKTA